LNFKVTEETEIGEIKRILMTLISETKTLHDTMTLRCNKLKEYLDLYQSNIQFDEFLFLKEKDVNRMNQYIKQLADSLQQTSKTELTLNERIRETARLRHDLTQTKSRNEFLEKLTS